MTDNKTPMIKYLTSLGVNFKAIGHRHYKFKSKGFMDLIVETWIEPMKTYDKMILSVAHYYIQEGDMMRDPEITYEITDNLIEIPLTYTQDSLGIYQHVFETREGIEMINPSLMNELKAFTKIWIRNLKQQGFEKEPSVYPTIKTEVFNNDT